MEPDPEAETESEPEEFHGWRLVGVLAIAMLTLAGLAILVDYLVLGSWEGRVY